MQRKPCATAARAPTACRRPAERLAGALSRCDQPCFRAEIPLVGEIADAAQAVGQIVVAEPPKIDARHSRIASALSMPRADSISGIVSTDCIRRSHRLRHRLHAVSIVRGDAESQAARTLGPIAAP